MRFVRPALLVAIFIAPLFAYAQGTPVLSQPFPAQTLAPGGAAVMLDVRNYITVPGVTGTKFAKFDTVFGPFSVQLRDDAAPRHVANFLAYVQTRAYDTSFIHRSASLEGGPVSIVQGGGYTPPIPPVTIPKLAPIALEYNLPNARGTLAAARTTDVNSATSEWYFNVRDNSTILGTSNGGGYSVFGSVLGGGMTVVDQIAALPRFNGGGAFGEIPLRNFSSGDVAVANLVSINSVREATLFPTGGGTSVIDLSMQNSAPNVVSVLLSGSSLTLTPVGSGNATVTVRATDVHGAAAEGSFTVRVAGGAPVFQSQPISQTIAASSTLVLSAPATAAGSYQWKRNGADVPGATSATLVVKSVTAADAGAYVVSVANDLATITSEPANVSVVTTTNPGRLINLSILTPLAAGETMTMGTVLGGSGTSGTKPVLARAAGPSLSQLGVTGFLPDPTMTLISSGTTVASNNDWGGNAALSAAFTEAGAFAYTSAASRDAAIFQPGLAPGNYTVQVSDTGTGTGTVIAELYDSSGAAQTATTPRLINVSVLKQISASGLTAGFVVGGSTAKGVLIRAVGPTLGTLFGIGGAMADPQLKLFAGSNMIASNDDWGGLLEISSAADSVGAFRLTSVSSKDAVLLLSLPPGNYTAQVNGASSGTGTAIIEVYEVP